MSRKRRRDDIEDALSEPLIQAPRAALPFNLARKVRNISSKYSLDEQDMAIDNPSSLRMILAEPQNGACFPPPTEFDLSNAAATISLVIDPGSDLERCRKAPRRDRSSSNESLIANCDSPDSSSRSGPQDPPIDQFTQLLGIGWALVGSDLDVQAAARGCARYIENHYPSLTGAKILLKSKGLDASLVETEQGFYLFEEDLGEGRLVGCDWETCLEGLKRSPIKFAQTETLKAARSPVLFASRTSVMRAWVNDGSSGNSSSTSMTSYDEDEAMIVD